MPALGTFLTALRRKGSTEVAFPPAGWVGSKAAKRGDLVVVDSNGRVDQVVAAGTAITSATSPGRLAFMGTAMSASDAQGTACKIEKFDDDTLLELPAITDNPSPDLAAATTTAMIGKQFQGRRVGTTGYYAVNTNQAGTPVFEVVAISKRYPVGEVGGTLLCRVLPASRLA